MTIFLHTAKVHFVDFHGPSEFVRCPVQDCLSDAVAYMPGGYTQGASNLTRTDAVEGAIENRNNASAIDFVVLYTAVASRISKCLLG